MNENAYKYYPKAGEINDWIEKLWRFVNDTPCQVEVLNDSGVRNMPSPHYMGRDRIVKFSPKGMVPFYGFWQPVLSGPCPLVVHVPGYGAEISAHTDIAGENYNVLQLSPMGYWTPDGFDVSLQKNDNWPVLPDTIETQGNGGYFYWLANCMMAVKWAWEQECVLKDRVSFFGTSQGGGGSLLLGSIFYGRGTRCVAADEPFLTDYPLANWRGAYGIAKAALDAQKNEADAWGSLGLIDTVSHAFRMKYPVLLTKGTADDTCPPETVDTLYNVLDTNKIIFSLKDRTHGYNYEFVRLVSSWLGMYA